MIINNDNGDSNNRPKLSDPKEFAIIKKVYFSKLSFRVKDNEDIDIQEHMDRLQKRKKILKQQSR